MEDYPETVLDFEDRFATEAACREYLAEIRWPDGFRCPRCEHREAWRTERGLWHCRGCGFQTSVTAGTIFQDTRKPLRLWFRAMWYVVSQKQGVSALGLQRVLGLSRYETTWIWLHKLRTAMVRPGRDRLSGTVQVDETYIGGERSGKCGRGAAGKTLVVIAVEDQGKHVGRIRLLRVPDASAVSLSFAVQEMIQPGSVVNTDGWAGYATLGTKGYIHEEVRPIAEVGENLLPLAHRVSALLKRWLGGTHQGAVRPSHLDYYLDEFTFRFNRRTSRSRGKLFYRLMQQTVQVGPVMGDDVRGGKR
ncbi:MAG TPA: IS1595 family transposase [Candidatus Hydrogenedentes bacterium]|nr:IS1595 family transposase [Candidatus Hydrogenedentota bacterium]HRT67017.1 IS1595 family transposase [Candidatus Hydrogenedentota bacterium]